MKRAMLLGFALLFLSGAASGQYLAVYADETRSASHVWVEQGDYVNVYLFAFPTQEGVICIELNTFTQTWGDLTFRAFNPVYHEDAAQPVMGAFPNGDLVGCWNSCHYDWIWLCHTLLLVESSDGYGWLLIRPYQGPPVQPFAKILTCTGREIEAYQLCEFGFNCVSICEVAVEEKSWGAIKELYK
jgi:hypothetical protein